MPATATINNIPQAIYAVARQMEKKGGKPFKDYIKSAAKTLGMKESDFRALYDSQKEKMAKSEAIAARSQALDEFRAKMSSIKLPVSIRNLVDEAAALEKEYDINVLITIDSEGTLSSRIGGVRAGRNTKNADEMSENSRISSWAAYQKGLDMGDEMPAIEKLGRRKYRDDEGYEFNNLTAYIAEWFPDSHAAELLRKYGQID